MVQQSLTPAREECSKYDLTTAPSLFLIVQEGGLLLVVSHLFAVPILVYGWGRTKKKKKTKI